MRGLRRELEAYPCRRRWSAELNILFFPFSWPLQQRNKLGHPTPLVDLQQATFSPVTRCDQFSVLSAEEIANLFVTLCTGRVTFVEHFRGR